MELHKLSEELLEGKSVESFFNNKVFEKYLPNRDLFYEDTFESFIDSRNVKKVLIVEDDLSQLNILEDLLLEIDPELQVDWETDADRAINRIVSEKTSGIDYCAVISDIELKAESSGMDLFDYCVQSEPLIEIILISAHSREKLRKKYFHHSEPLDYMQKPINFGAFYKKMAPVLASA